MVISEGCDDGEGGENGKLIRRRVWGRFGFHEFPGGTQTTDGDVRILVTKYLQSIVQHHCLDYDVKVDVLKPRMRVTPLKLMKINFSLNF